MQAHILHLREAEALVEARECEIRRELCKEIRTFAKVQARWGLGPIKATIETCLLNYCPKGKVPGMGNRHMVVHGFFPDEGNLKRSVFLGYGLDHAYLRIPDIKRVLYSPPTE